MSEVVIRVENLGKLYRIGAQERYKTFRDTLTDAFAKPFRLVRNLFSGNGASPQDPTDNTIWALKDVSFEVKQGEVIGVIGRNGAGKSTLLKILSRITEPTEGFAEIRGRVGSLLEVGTGFHPELTGRENIFLNGAILGMRKAEIVRKFDEIVAFAEVEKFIDTPVKHYSSGMYLRLAFAVAAHLDPEILLVDEVLAVGDAAFQKKCLGKMGDVAREGRTVLFVSHNMQAITTLTNRSLLISGGHCICNGPTQHVVSEYLRVNCKREQIYLDAPSSDEPRITRVELRTSLPDNIQINGKPMEVVFEIATPFPINGARLAFHITNNFQQPYVVLWTYDSERPLCREPGRFRVVCRIPKLRLYQGEYTLNAYLMECYGGKRFQSLDNICPFEIVMYGIHREGVWNPYDCAYLEDCDWEITTLVKL